MRPFFTNQYLILLFLCLFISACPSPEPPGGNGDLEAMQTDGIQLESKRFNNDTAIIKADNIIFKFYGNWADKWSPVLGVNILVSNNSKNTVILKLSELNLKTGNGETGMFGDIVKKEKDGNFLYLRHARKDGKQNNDLPEDTKLLPGSNNEFDIVFLTSASLKSNDAENLFHLSVPIEFEDISDSRKDLNVIFKTVESRAGNKPYSVD